jgi:hypothetical protein
MKLTVFLGTTVMLGSLMACDRREEMTPSPQEMAPAERQPMGEREALGEREPVVGRDLEPNERTVPQASAIDSITKARCERELRCGNVGPDEEYSSEQECMQKIRSDWHEELEARECPGGVVEKELNECLNEVRNDDCGNPFDTLGRIAACRESDLCKSL